MTSAVAPLRYGSFRTLWLASMLSAFGTFIQSLSSSQLMLDLTGCTFIDSLGIAALVHCADEMHRRGRVVCVVCRAPQVRRTLSLSGVDEQIPVCWTREEGVELLADPRQSVPRPQS